MHVMKSSCTNLRRIYAMVGINDDLRLMITPGNQESIEADIR